jgi:putative intracellular protease/amidase
MTLSVIANQTGPIPALVPGRRTLPNGTATDNFGIINPMVYATHTYANAPKLDVLLVPGGSVPSLQPWGAGDNSMEEFVAGRYPELKYLLSVCTGSVELALAGMLDGRRATTNKWLWSAATQYGKNVTWVPSARWVVDGNVWTASGVAAGQYITSFIHEVSKV